MSFTHKPATFAQDFDQAVRGLNGAADEVAASMERIKAELDFANRLAEANPAQRDAWQALILQAAALVTKAVAAGTGIDDAVRAAEDLLAPIGTVAKQYTIHCAGHAHIDMNWMWGWQETVTCANDTFSTVDKLMDEFPTFHFSQSQTSVYQIMKDYTPELYARVRQRVREGRWEITASQWVEGDRNLASGESICRHLLYTRRFLREEFGLPYDAVKVDWEPDCFGHAATLPTLDAQGGVRYYYLHRASHGPELFWWQGPDGARLLTFDDCKRGYNGQINPYMVNGLLDFEKATGLKEYLFVYGVGDHGGGPTRRDLHNAVKMDTWPIFPHIALSTVDAFFAHAEQHAQDLPVVDHELNYVFEGCYTSESNIKRANRLGENALVEAEICALLGRGLAAMPYPTDALHLGWRHVLFNQFHDILPGSGVKETYEYAQGLFQEVIAQTSIVKTRALRAIAGRVNTAALCRYMPDAVEGVPAGQGLGAGAGDISRYGTAVTGYNAGGTCCDPFVIFNPSPWARTEMITAKLWDRDYADGQIGVTDDTGNTVPAQVLQKAHYWGHHFTEVAFPAPAVPGLGYRTYSVARHVNPGTASGCSGDGRGTMENEFFRVQVEQSSGAIIHLIDKRTGIDLVPAGERLGVLEYLLEAPHPMTAWCLGQAVTRVPFTAGATIACQHRGPYVASVRADHKYHDSTFALTITLAAGVPRIDFTLETNWLERGGPEIGVPALKIAFPLALTDGTARYECPNGSVTRSTTQTEIVTHTVRPSNCYADFNAKMDANPAEVPAQKWADLTGTHAGTAEPVGATLVNDTKYGHSIIDATMRLTLLRSSYDPDPLPELGKHVIRFALLPHVGAWDSAQSTRAGYAFALPLNVVNTTSHDGDLPMTAALGDLLTPNVMLSGMKKAEDSDALIVRLYEMEGKPTLARLRLAADLAAANAPAVQTDVLERPLPQNTAKMAGDVLEVQIPAHGMVTVKIG